MYLQTEGGHVCAAGSLDEGTKKGICSILGFPYVDSVTHVPNAIGILDFPVIKLSSCPENAQDVSECDWSFETAG